MNVGCIFLFVIFVTLLTSTKEVPIEGSTFPPEPDKRIEFQHDDHVDLERGLSSEELQKLNFTIDIIDRRNHSRMLSLTSTLGYDEWWFLPTRRPQISPKDFPGRPGVATWKEISPGGSEDSRKSHKTTGPTAAGVSSGSERLASKYHYAQLIWKSYWLIILLFCFCWT